MLGQSLNIISVKERERERNNTAAHKSAGAEGRSLFLYPRERKRVREREREGAREGGMTTCPVHPLKQQARSDCALDASFGVYPF